jgi:glycosyltransferase involved in cell wall biosynthesis
MTRTDPVFTVVIPTCNRAALVGRAVRSVLAQSFQDFEIVVADDASTDDTPEVIAAFGDSRIRYLRREVNGGSSATRNTGLRAARGELISFLDDDDEYHPEFLERMRAAFAAAGPEVRFGWCGVRYVRDTGSGPFEDGTKAWTPTRPAGWDPYFFLIEMHRVATSWGFTVRRSIRETVGYFDEELRALVDTDYVIRAARAHDFVALPDVLVTVYRHSGARLTLPTAKRAEACMRILEKHRGEVARDPATWAAFHYKVAALYYRAGLVERADAMLRTGLRRRPYHRDSLGLLLACRLRRLAPQPLRAAAARLLARPARRGRRTAAPGDP